MSAAPTPLSKVQQGLEELCQDGFVQRQRVYTSVDGFQNQTAEELGVSAEILEQLVQQGFLAGDYLYKLTESGRKVAADLTPEEVEESARQLFSSSENLTLEDSSHE